MTDQEFVRFLQDVLPLMGLKWAGFRKVRGTVRRRVARRLRELAVADLDAYRAYLDRTPEEWSRLHVMCRIPISRFFRDRNVFHILEDNVLPFLAGSALKAGRNKLRCLCIGCASGEEPYSMNLVWLTILAQKYPDLELEIIAADADSTMIKRALAGRYKASSLKEVPTDIREAAFEPVDGDFRLRSAFRAGVQFEHLDIRDTVPSGPFDIVMCRNLVFTYFSDAAQIEFSRRIADRLGADGFLVVGGHERLPCEDGRLLRIRPHLPIYQKVGTGQEDGGALSD